MRFGRLRLLLCTHSVMPGKQRNGVTIGRPVKCMTAGAATPSAQFITDRFENEALTLNKANWKLLMAKSEEATSKFQ